MVDDAAGKASVDGRLSRYAAIFESAVDFAIIVSDRDGLITDWNTGAETIFGWSAEEMIGEPADRFFTPEDRAQGRVEHEMNRTLEAGRGNDERWHLRKDGARFWANGEMMLLRNDGGHIGFLKIVRDDIMLAAGFDDIIKAVNPGWEWTLGWTEHDLLSHSLFDLIHPDDLEHTIAGAKGLSEGEFLARIREPLPAQGRQLPRDQLDGRARRRADQRGRPRHDG